jgi:methionyl-tRNA formyltransferase
MFVSNGCPVLIPVSELRKPGRLFLNVHPSALPELRGPHAANGVLLHGHRRAGATVHFMDDGFDTGPVLHQESFEVTPDVDLGLLYSLLFDLEARVFRVAIDKLAASGFTYSGEPQRGEGSSYRRTKEDRAVDFAAMPQEEILRRIRAFGIVSQGVFAQLDGKGFRIWDAEAVTNPYVLSLHDRARPGSLVLRYQDKLLVRTCEGLIKVRRFQSGER